MMAPLCVVHVIERSADVAAECAGCGDRMTDRCSLRVRRASWQMPVRMCPAWRACEMSVKVLRLYVQEKFIDSHLVSSIPTAADTGHR